MASPMGRAPPPAPPTQQPRQAMPGPPGLPWVGQLPAYLATKFFPKTLLKWTEEYGGVYKLELVGKTYVVVTDPSLIPEVVGRGFPGMPKSAGYAMWDAVISPHRGVQGLFTVVDNNSTWRSVRRAYGPAMGPGTMSLHYPIIVKCCDQLAARLDVEGGYGTRLLELNNLLKALTLDMLGLSAFGIDFGCLGTKGVSKLAHDIEKGMAECGARTSNPARRLLPWLYEDERREGEEAMASFHRACEEVWAQLLARGPPAADDESMGAQLLRLADPAKGKDAASHEQAVAEVATLIVAGYETTANTLTWMLFALHRHQGETARLRRELQEAGLAPQGREAGGAAAAAGVAPVPLLQSFLAPGAFERLAALPYLDAYIRECLRAYTVTPNGALKMVAPGTGPAQLGGYEIPENSTVWIPFWSLHNSRRWWEAPEEFKPERWIGQDPRSAGALGASRCPVTTAATMLQGLAGGSGASAAAASAAAAQPGRAPAEAHTGGSSSSSSSAVASSVAVLEQQPAGRAAAAPGEAGGGGSSGGGSSDGAANARAIRFMPFSDGSRNCVGQHLATLQLKAAVAFLACRFDFQLDDAVMGGVEGTLDKQRVNLTLEVEGGMWMRAVPRTH